MAENFVTVINIVENIKIEGEKCTKNDDLPIPEAIVHLENGNIKKISEEAESPKTEEKYTTESESINVAENGNKTLVDVAVGQVMNEAIKEQVEFSEIAMNKESESKIIEEAEKEGDNVITRSFEVVQINETLSESKESKFDEIVILQETSIIPPKEDQTQLPSKQITQLASWDTRKTIFFYFFVFAFIAWILAYYAFDTGLIPNDKK